MIALNPNERFTPNQIFEHKYMKGQETATAEEVLAFFEQVKATKQAETNADKANKLENRANSATAGDVHRDPDAEEEEFNVDELL